MATQTITSDINVDIVAAGGWRSVDSLVIANGAVVTVNTDQKKGWSRVTINNGKLRIENDSTTVPLVFRMTNVATTQAAITPVNGLAALEIDGDWIEVGVSDGTPSQSFTVPFNDHIAALWVETAPDSGIYRPWSNILRVFPVLDQEWYLEGWDSVADGIRGYVFKQSVNPNPKFHSVYTGVNLTLASRFITVSSTSGIFPGAHVVGTNIAANTVVERVIDATGIELNLLPASANASATITIYNTYECYTANEVVFGDGVRGNIPPSGCRIRIPNILITSAKGIDVSTGVNGVNIATTGGGIVKANTCLFAMTQNTFTTPQTLHLLNCGFSFPQTISKCYDLVIDGLVFSIPPLFPYLTANRVKTDYNNANLVWSYLKGQVDNFYYFGTSAHNPGSTAASVAGLSLQYCEGLVGSKWHLQRPTVVSVVRGVSFYYSNRCIVDDVTVLGFTNPLDFYVASENEVTNVTFGLMGYRSDVAPAMAANAWNMTAHSPGGLPIQNGQQYCLKFSRRAVFCPGAEDLPSTRTLVTVAYKPVSPYMPTYFRVQVGGNSVVLTWNDVRNVVSPSPLYRIYRSTVEGCPVRDGTTLLGTITVVTTTTYTDSTAVNGTKYWYVLRKYLSTDLLTYEDTPAVEATPAAEFVPTNYLLQSNAYSSTSWVKSGVTISSSSDIASPMSSGVGSRAIVSGYRAQVTAANGTLTNTVTGLTIGETYTASIYVSFKGAYRDGVAGGVTTTGMRLTFGTAYVDFTVGKDWTRHSVSFVATATSHAFVLTFATSGEWVDMGTAQVNKGGTLCPVVRTTSTAVTAGVFAPSTFGFWASRSGGDHGNLGLYMPTEVMGEGGQYWRGYIGATSDFVPSEDNLWFVSVPAAMPVISILQSSSRNKIKGVTQSGVGGKGVILDCQTSSSDNVIEDVTVEPSMCNYDATYYPYGSAMRLLTDSNRNLMKNWDCGYYFERDNPSLLLADNTANDNVLENIRCRNSAFLNRAYNNGQKMKGVAGGFPVLSDATAYSYIPLINTMPSAFTGVYNTIFAEMYHTETTGALHLFFCASTDENPPMVLSGTAAFSNTGTLYLQKAGDSATYTWPHKIYGVSGFRAIAPGWRSNWLSANNIAGSGLERADSVLLEFQVDTGSGFTAWAEATPANLAAVVVSAVDGFWLKLRVTAQTFMVPTGGTASYSEGLIIRQMTSGATARVVKIDSALGFLILDQITGTWTDSSTLDILRDSDSAILSTGVSLIDSKVMGPTANSRLVGLQIFTNVDQTVMYPSDPITLTFTGLQAGTDVVVRAAGTETVLFSVEDIGGTSAVYTYYTSGVLVDVDFYKPGYMPYTNVRNYLLGSASVSLPISQTPDSSYLE